MLIKVIKDIVDGTKEKIQYYKLIYKDSRTPKVSKILLWFAITYLLSPMDIIPDCIPILGHLDDILIVPLLIVLAMCLVPKAVKAEALELCKQNK